MIIIEVKSKRILTYQDYNILTKFMKLENRSMSSGRSIQI